MKEKKDRIEDAVCATKAAIEEGYVAGGGMSFINAIDALRSIGLDEIYFPIILALHSVKDQIMRNCGVNPADYDEGIGFDANLMRPANMIESGIINPAKSDRLALENAISVLNLYLSSSCLVVNEDVQF